MNEYKIGIDIGSNAIKIVISENIKKTEKPHILHAIESPMHGFRHGYIVDANSALKSIKFAIAKTEKISKLKIDRALFSIGGIGLSSQFVKTNINITNKDGEVNDYNIDELVQKSEYLFSQKYPNKKILHIIPVKYLVDGRDVLGSPIGMYGKKLEAKIIFVTILEHHYDAFISLIEQTGITIQEDLIASPLADAEASANYAQKSQGCIIVNIGSETTSLATFENNTLTSLHIKSIGSNSITNDIALGLQIPLETAENVKKLKNKDYSKKKVEEIIQARLIDILEIIESHLKSIHKNRLLPAGIIFSGAGSKIEFLNDYTKKYLRLPTQNVSIVKYSKKTKRSSSIGEQFSIAYGLSFVKNVSFLKKSKLNMKKVKKMFSKFFNQIMP
ncbi:MAG: hypothetical protein LR005_01505 [Candidatus Pacebacteria bacterium]|nr:hypothetical protein [Candidatus Paceibacterota bacterium]